MRLTLTSSSVLVVELSKSTKNPTKTRTQSKTTTTTRRPRLIILASSRAHHLRLHLQGLFIKGSSRPRTTRRTEAIRLRLPHLEGCRSHLLALVDTEGRHLGWDPASLNLLGPLADCPVLRLLRQVHPPLRVHNPLHMFLYYTCTSSVFLLARLVSSYPYQERSSVLIGDSPVPWVHVDFLRIWHFAAHLVWQYRLQRFIQVYISRMRCVQSH